MVGTKPDANTMPLPMKVATVIERYGQLNRPGFLLFYFTYQI